jgi:hypothetical protein
VSDILTSRRHGYTYDAVREALKSAGDASGRVDVEDFADVVSQLRQGAHLAASTADTKGRVKIGGSTGGSAHTINEDERTEFTRHINAVSSGICFCSIPFVFLTMYFDHRFSLVIATLGTACPFLPTQCESSMNAAVSGVGRSKEFVLKHGI